MNSGFVSRIRLLSGILLLAVVVLVMKLYFVQVVHGESFSERADRQYTRPQQGLFDRGSVFFENKNGEVISAATLASGFTVAINPSLIEDAELAYRQLTNVIEIDKDSFFLKAGKNADPYEEVAKQVSRENAERIEALELSGVGVYKDRWRLYPGESLAAQTVGFVAFKGDELSGRYGLERYYDDVLKRSEEDVYVNFFAEVFSNIGDVVLDGGQGRTGDIVTTIEPSVQAFLESELKTLSEKWNAESAGGVIVRPKNGEIVALGVFPSFDLNQFQRVEDSSVFSNPVVESVFEMGSIIKPLTMAAGLDAEAVTAETTYNDKGSITLNTATISNYDGKGRGVVDMQEVLNQSLNTGAVFVVSRLGNERFAEYMLNFGIGEETGIDLPGEIPGLVGNLSSPRDIEYATAAFGQGIAMTPIATVRALLALANGGMLVTPHLVKEIRYDIGFSKKVFPDEEKRVIREETSDEITRMLVRVVDEALLGGTVKLDRYSVAAKTGTAQIANEQEGGYYDDRFFHSFFGYMPAYSPEYLVFLYVNQPREVRFASQTLTNPFTNLVKFLISYYEIPPDR